VSEARADLPPAASAMGLSTGLPPPPGGDVVLPKPSVGSAPAATPIPTDNADDPLAPVMARIAKGETGGNPDPYTAKYGGGNFGFPDWEGRPGPAGISHAAGKLQWQPATWNAAAKDMVAQGLPAPDFKNPADQERAGRFWAVKTYHDKTGRNLIEDAKNNRVDYSALAGQWPSLSPNHLGNQLIAPNGSFARERMAVFDRESAQLAERDRAEYERRANEPDPTAKERAELLTDARQRAARSREMYEDIAKHPPPDKPIDALQNFGSIGTMLALLMGGMGRHHMNGALAAAGAMMQAAQANNHEQFERQYKIWDHQSNTALHLSQLESDEVRSLLEDKRMSENERQARLHAFFEEHQMTWQGQQLRAGLLEHVLSSETHLEELRLNAANQKLMFGQMRLQSWLATPEGQQATEDQIDQKAAELGVSGGRGAGSGPRSAVGMFMQEFKKEKPHATSTELAEAAGEFRRIGSLDSGFASGVLARQVISLNTVADHLLLVKEYGEALNNGQIPRANAIANRIATELGKPEVVTFEAGRDIMADEVVRLLTTTGGTEADRAGMQSRLSASQSPAQLGGTIKVFERFTAGRFEALRQQYAQGDEKREQRFMDELLTPKARQVFGEASTPPDTVVPPGSTSASSRSAAPSNGVPVPAEHASDPDGTPYKGSDGKTYVKRGNQMVPQ
jgi:hypothetical protein